MEAGEILLLDAAIRETREELGIVTLSPKLRGELHFQFVDGYSLACSVFVCSWTVSVNRWRRQRQFPCGPLCRLFPTTKCGQTIFVGYRTFWQLWKTMVSSTSSTKHCSRIRCSRNGVNPFGMANYPSAKFFAP